MGRRVSAPLSLGNVAVVIPWRYSADRARGLEHALWWWDAATGMRAYCGYDDEPDGEPWRKGVNIAEGILAALAVDPDLKAVVVADADVIMGGREPDLFEAVHAVRQGSVAWSVPHRDIWRHDVGWTHETIMHRSLSLADDPNVVTHRGHPGGGLVVINRRIIDERVLPDPRFAGWGQEDDSWAFALSTLYGRPWRGTAPLHHLWHTPQARMTRETGSRESAGLYREYLRARTNRGSMRRLVDEGWAWWDDRERQRRGAP